MATCKYCGKSGWFTSVNRNGLCGKCVPVVELDIQQRTRIVNESATLVDTSKKLETRLARCDLIIEHVSEMRKYEERGIPISDPPPSVVLSNTIKAKDEIVAEAMHEHARKARSKAETATTVRTKVSALSKALLTVREYMPRVSDMSSLETIERELKSAIHKTQLDSFMDAAQKAEFKGQVKKAIDQYQEALYFLKTDDIDDSLQQKSIQQIESKIQQLKEER